jgi:hypothetical protein
MNTISLILMLLSAVSIGLCVYILARIKHVVYLLEQPVVKKISPDMKLKTVKVEDGEDTRRHNHRPAQGQNSGANAGRAPQAPKPEGQRDRNHRPEGQQGPRPERGGNEHRGHDRNRDRDRDRERGPRQDRGERTERGERHERGERPERQRPRLDVFSNEKEAAPAPAESAHHQDSAPAHTERPALAPRRPLAANVEREEPVTSAPVSNQPELPADAIFVGDDGDMQHGRRTQLKKKPRFNLDEEEIKAEENKVQA